MREYGMIEDDTLFIDAMNLASKNINYSKTTQCFFQFDGIQDWNHCVFYFLTSFYSASSHLILLTSS